MRLSISARLIGIAIVTILALLPLFGYLLSSAFMASAQLNFDQRIETYLLLLAGRIDLDGDGRIVFSRAPGDDRFEQPYSGWYWQISLRGEVRKTSRSLWDEALSVPQAPANRPVELIGPRQERLRGATLPVTLKAMNDSVVLQVMGPRAEIDAETASFNWLLARSLGSLGLILLVVLVVQIRWGLAPLRDMADGLKRVRNGEAPRLNVRLPADLSSVAVAMNEVLSHQEQLLARGRSVAGNLAHALKTPLSAIRMKIAALPEPEGLRQEMSQVERIIDHHLTLAAAAGRASGAGRRTGIKESLDPIIDAMRSLYADRAVEVESLIPQQLQVMMDPQDLQELTGNLLDNAVKWARTRARLEVRADGDDVLLIIEDDGRGIDQPQRQMVLGRGLRLDEQQPGSGLGLAIVKDLADLYGLAVELDHADLGGLRVVVRFQSPPPVA